METGRCLDTGVGGRGRGACRIALTIVVIAMLPSPLHAQTPCDTGEPCPCGQTCELRTGLCANIPIPSCAADADCPQEDPFTGVCVDRFCELGCAAPPVSELQRIIDDCAEGSTCELPAGEFAIVVPLLINKSIRLVGAGNGLAKDHGREPGPVTVVQMQAGLPALRIRGDILVYLEDFNLEGGGIEIGGLTDLCDGIEDPADVERADVEVRDMLISADSSTANHAIRFSGGSFTAVDLHVVFAPKSGLYVANATGDIVVIDAEYNDNEEWGILICNQTGSGQIFIDDVEASNNGRGGVGIVGGARPICIQNTGAVGNARFGFLLLDVAATLLFNSSAGFTFPGPGPLSFGDGMLFIDSPNVFLWNVVTALNSRAGYAAFNLGSSVDTHIHVVGDFEALNNVINLNVEGGASFHTHETQTSVTGVCGGEFLAPPVDDYCEDGFIEDACQVVSTGLSPPDTL